MTSTSPTSMSGADHAMHAENLIDSDGWTHEQIMENAALAQVHATLAQTMATMELADAVRENGAAIAKALNIIQGQMPA